MLADLLKEHAKERGAAEAIRHAGCSLTYAELEIRAREFLALEGARSTARVGVAIDDPFDFIAAAAALDRAGANALLIGVREAAELDALKQSLKLDAIWGPCPPSPSIDEGPTAPGPGLVTLLTSGTTGAPKQIEHRWETLARPVRRDPSQSDARWLCAYPLRLYAGTQVMLQALVNGATLVIPESPDPKTVARTLVDDRVTHASGTPTFWRQIGLFGERSLLGSSTLRQITLGGEAVSGNLLQVLRSLFPDTRIVHIYASTELGRLFSVTDGLAGFPSSYLDVVPGGAVELEIRDGELYARSRHAMLGCEEWTATGDLVQVVGDRVLFRGRRSDIINVGGFKVSPLKVEAAIHDVDGVADVRVFAKKSSLAGQLVACEVVLVAEADPSEIKKAILSKTRSELSPPEQPRIVTFVQHIAASAALKVARGEEG